MSQDYAIEKRNKVRQLREKATYDKATVHGVLDAGLIAHVAFVQDGEPVVVPMLYGREDETLGPALDFGDDSRVHGGQRIIDVP